MFPNFLVAGSMKCGTSALFRGVTNHPDVFGAKGKELHYFDQNYEQGPQWYEAHFADAGDVRALGEGTPYLGNETATARMTNDLPDARLLFILRHPVDRAYSHYWHNRRRQRENREFEEAFRTDLESDQEIGRWMNYWRLGTFSKYLEAIAAEVGRENMHVVLSRDLREQRAETLRGAWAHIGVDPDQGTIEVRERSGPRKLRRSLKNLIKGRSDDTSYPPLDRSLRNDLTKVYRDDVIRLQEFLQRDLSHWLEAR